tara:strand:- start:18400 stop:18996 length:597 start_codon:yes stop_codon:yes gene_type:complete
MVIFKKILLISFFLVLLSCKADKRYVLIEPGKVELNKIYSVNTNKKWSQFQESEYNFLFWTVDGYTLQRIVFFKPIEEGNSLFDHDSFFTRENDKRPIFNLKMNKFEIKDFFENCIIWSREFSSFKTSNLKNYKLNDQDGLSFDIEAQNELGLDYKGFAISVIKDKKLYVIYFLATKIEFFEKYKKEVKKIISSIEIL